MERHQLIEAVHQHFGINPSLRTRRRDVVDARSAVMVAMRSMYTFVEIAQFFPYTTKIEGKTVVRYMSHCTVVHAVKQHEDRYDVQVEKRKRPFAMYCDIYDFSREFLNNPKFRPISPLQLKEDLLREQLLRRELEKEYELYREQAQATAKHYEKQIKKMDRAIAKVELERDHLKRAFTQLYNEKKARDEKALKKTQA